MSLKDFVLSIPELTTIQQLTILQKLSDADITIDNLLSNDIKESDLIALDIKMGPRRKILRLAKEMSRLGQELQSIKSADKKTPENHDFINLTPNEIILFTKKVDVLKLPSRGCVTLMQKETCKFDYCDINVSRAPTYTGICGLPVDLMRGKLIVTEDVCKAVSEGIARKELKFPDFAWFCLDNSPDMVVRDKEGEGCIIGYRGLIKYA